MEVHQMFLNEEDWLVAAPYRADGEALLPEGFPKEQVPGDYEVILHKLNINYSELEVNRPEKITLGADGSVTGAYEGTWSLKEGTSFLELNLGQETYSGVVLSMEPDGMNLQTPVFTALGKTNQLTLWGSKVLDQ